MLELEVIRWSVTSTVGTEQYNHLCEYRNLSKKEVNEWIVLKHSWQHRENALCKHLCEYRCLSRCSKWMYCTPAFLAIQRTMRTPVRIPESFQKKLVGECIVFQHSWLHARKCICKHLCEYWCLSRCSKLMYWTPAFLATQRTMPLQGPV